MLHAHILIGQHDTDGAIAILRKVMETTPESTDVRMVRQHPKKNKKSTSTTIIFVVSFRHTFEIAPPDFFSRVLVFFWGHGSSFLSPCVVDADWCLRSDVTSNSRLQALSHMLVLHGGPGLVGEAERLLRQTLVLLDEHDSVNADDSSDRYVIDKSMVLNNLANLLQWHRQDIAGAEMMARQALALNAHDPNILHTLGLLLEKEHQTFDDAKAMYRRALRLDPEHVDANCNLGWLAYRTNRDRSHACMDPPGSREGNGGHPYFMDEAGNYPEGLLRAALVADGEHRASLCHLGVLLVETERPAEARSLYDRAAAIGDSMDNDKAAVAISFGKLESFFTLFDPGADQELLP